MSETGITVAVIGFVLGSIQYHYRIKRQEAKDDLNAIARSNYGKFEQGFMAFSTVLIKMREEIKDPNMGKDKKIAYEEILKRYNWSFRWMIFWGIFAPIILLLIYFLKQWNL